MQQRLVRIAVRLIGPLLLALVLWRMSDLRDLGSILVAANIPLLASAALLNGVNIHLKVLRWKMLLGTRGYHYGSTAAWRAILPSMYVGMITPGRVGDVLRIQYMRHDIDVPYSEGLAVVVMDRFCDLYVLLAFVVLGVGHFAGILRGELGWITWLAVAATAAFPLLLLVRGPVDRVLARVYRRIARKPDRGGVERFLTALRAQVGPRLVLTVPLTAGAFLVQYAQGWIAARALSLELGFVDVMYLLAITSLLSLMPISMSGVGVRELFLSLAFPALGLAAEQGVAFGLTIFAVVYVTTILAGLVAWQWSPPPVSGNLSAAERPSR